LAPASLEMERTMLGPRTELALAYARENGVNRIEGARDAWLGVVCAGKSYFDVRQALRDMGLGDEPALQRAGVRILKLGMLWPLEAGIVRELAQGIDEIVVVEEKRAFLEPLVKEALYDSPHTPKVLGKELLPAAGDLDADLIARAIGGRISRRARMDSV